MIGMTMPSGGRHAIETLSSSTKATRTPAQDRTPCLFKPRLCRQIAAHTMELEQLACQAPREWHQTMPVWRKETQTFANIQSSGVTMEPLISGRNSRWIKKVEGKRSLRANECRCNKKRAHQSCGRVHGQQVKIKAANIWVLVPLRWRRRIICMISRSWRYSKDRKISKSRSWMTVNRQFTKRSRGTLPKINQALFSSNR